MHEITGGIPDDGESIEVDPKPASGGKGTPAISGIEIFSK